jgi:hypothetical protein
MNCTCYPKASTQGCTEWSCMYHGKENERKQKAQRALCPVHGKSQGHGALPTVPGVPEEGGEG